jgi:tetratricopeptide (TPR) repeat protein
VGAVITGERYTYIPYIGLYFIVGMVFLRILNFGISGIQVPRSVSSIVGVLVIAVLAMLTYHRIGYWNDTVSLFEDARQKGGETQIGNTLLAIGYTYRGDQALDRGDLPQAIRDLSMAIERNDSTKRAYYSRGVAYSRLQEYQTALTDFNSAIRLDSGKAEFYNDRANARIELQQGDSALIDYTKAIALDPELAEAYANRARIYFLTGRRDLCCADLYRADSLGYAPAKQLLQEHCK